MGVCYYIHTRREEITMTPTLEVAPDELEARALTIQCLITEALAELDGLPPHPQRTRLGRHLMTARTIALAWREDGNMDTSKGVHP
jgi:hypothetical protein